MTNGQRAEVFGGLMHEVSRLRLPIGAITKADLLAAVDAADQWASDNAASFNAALPLPARTVLTAPLKARLLAGVILARHTNGV